MTEAGDPARPAAAEPTCHCGKTGNWRPILRIVPADAGQHFDIKLDKPLCDVDAANAQVSDFIPDDDTWAVIKRVVKTTNGTEPARGRVALVFEPWE